MFFDPMLKTSQLPRLRRCSRGSRQPRGDRPGRKCRSCFADVCLPRYYREAVNRGSMPGQCTNVCRYVEAPKKSRRHPGLPNQIWPSPSNNLAQPELRHSGTCEAAVNRGSSERARLPWDAADVRGNAREEHNHSWPKIGPARRATGRPPRRARSRPTRAARGNDPPRPHARMEFTDATSAAAAFRAETGSCRSR